MDGRLAGCLPGWTLIVRWTYGLTVELTNGRAGRRTNGWMTRSCSFSFSFSFSCRCSFSLFPVPCFVVRCWLLVGCPLLLSISTNTHTHTDTHKHTDMHIRRHQESPKDHGPIELMICGAKCEADSALPLKGN